MSPSLRIRLLAASSLLVGLALLFIGLSLSSAFNAALKERMRDELDEDVRMLSGYLTFDASGRLRLDMDLADPKALQPYGGVYWQIESDGMPPLRSRSLWDTALPVPPSSRPAGTAPTIVRVAGPLGQRLLLAYRTIDVVGPKGLTPVSVAAARDLELNAPIKRAFDGVMIPCLVIAGAALIGAMAMVIGYALAPFRELGRAIAALRSGRARQLVGAFPAEVMPVVGELNRLMQHESQSLARARAQAGDLAHGLKTPLAVLAALGRDAAARGDDATSREIEAQILMMERQVARSIARTRAGLNAALAHETTLWRPVAERVVGMMQRVATDRPLAWSNEIDAEASFPGDETDLFEVVGALLDNARKWAAGTVRITSRRAGERWTVTVEDDGPGMPEADVSGINRGRRLDETRSGSGFGLAIVRDLVEAYGGTLALGRSPLGGLSASLTL
jgi:signal transduction histidine kinase